MAEFNMMEVLRKAYLTGFSLQSNYARENAQFVGALASMGLISTKTGPNEYGNVWRATFEGVLKLTEKGIV